ncbi:MAG: hypothetical protein ACLTTE_08155, partial [Clostridia bacterium]
SKEDEVKDIEEEDVQTNTSIDGVIDLVVKHEEENVEIPLFMEIDRINRMYARRIDEINRESESLNKKVVYKKRTTQKKSFYTLLNKLFK